MARSTRNERKEVPIDPSILLHNELMETRLNGIRSKLERIDLALDDKQILPLLQCVMIEDPKEAAIKVTQLVSEKTLGDDYPISRISMAIRSIELYLDCNVAAIRIRFDENKPWQKGFESSGKPFKHAERFALAEAICHMAEWLNRENKLEHLDLIQDQKALDPTNFINKNLPILKEFINNTRASLLLLSEKPLCTQTSDPCHTFFKLILGDKYLQSIKALLVHGKTYSDFLPKEQIRRNTAEYIIQYLSSKLTLAKAALPASAPSPLTAPSSFPSPSPPTASPPPADEKKSIADRIEYLSKQSSKLKPLIEDMESKVLALLDKIKNENTQARRIEQNRLVELNKAHAAINTHVAEITDINGKLINTINNYKKKLLKLQPDTSIELSHAISKTELKKFTTMINHLTQTAVKIDGHLTSANNYANAMAQEIETQKKRDEKIKQSSPATEKKSANASSPLSATSISASSSSQLPASSPQKEKEKEEDLNERLPGKRKP